MHVPTSTHGLSPSARCRDLAQRNLFAKKRRHVDLIERMWENRVTMFHKRGFETTGGFTWNGEGSISVFQIGGGFHRDCRCREYTLRRGHVVSITRPKDNNA